MAYKRYRRAEYGVRRLICLIYARFALIIVIASIKCCNLRKRCVEYDIHELPDWPSFTWDYKAVTRLLAEVSSKQGYLLGQMQTTGLLIRDEAVLQTLTQDVLKTSEIEGESLNEKQVRSSIARRLGLATAGLVPSSRNVDGVVEMLLDAVQSYREDLTEEKWGNPAKCSHDSATRDIKDLRDKGVLQKDPGAGRSTSYSLIEK